jgi:hypothetical protein
VRDTKTAVAAKELVLDDKIPYEILQEAFNEDAKESKLAKNYMNALAIRRVEDSVQLIYPDSSKRLINVDSVKLTENGDLSGPIVHLKSNISLLKRPSKQTSI